MKKYNFIKKNIALIIAIIGIVLTIHFYSIQKRKPFYYISDKVIQIYDNNNVTSKIQVMNSESEIITENIYLTTITFWNAGKIPIKNTDIVKPIIVKIFPIKELIDYSVVNQTDSDIINFQLKQTNNTPNDSIGELQLSWNHIDSKFGVQFQIIYSSSKKAQIEFGGFISGAGHPVNGEYFLKKHPSLFIIFLVIWSLIIPLFFYRIDESVKKPTLLYILFSIGSWFLGAFLIFKYFFSNPFLF